MMSSTVLLVLLAFVPSPTLMSVETSYRYLPDNTIRVTSVLLEPYLMLNPEHTDSNGLPQYIGYIPDLMVQISRIIAIDYVIIVAPDNRFGYKTTDGSWDGMIGQVARQEAEIAAGPMYPTSQRARVVDFTVPYLHVEATLLLRKPPPGTELGIHSVEDLINQSEIKYGTLDRGILIREFKDTNSTILRMMYRKMRRFEPTTFTETNEDGIERVRMEKYAFVLPHTIGEYMAMQEPCDLVTVDRFLMRRGFSLAVGKGSTLLSKLNWAIRTLEQSGRLKELYTNWWVSRSRCRGGQVNKQNSALLQASIGRAVPSSELSGLLIYTCTVLWTFLYFKVYPS